MQTDGHLSTKPDGLLEQHEETLSRQDHCKNSNSFIPTFATVPHFTQCLIVAGMDATLPAAIIQQGATPQQRVITGTLADIAQRAQDAGLISPALTVIGTVVSTREALEWYEKAKADPLS